MPTQDDNKPITVPSKMIELKYNEGYTAGFLDCMSELEEFIPDDSSYWNEHKAKIKKRYDL